MSNCCYCGGKVGFFGVKLKDGGGVCLNCSYICETELKENGKNCSSAELSKFDSAQICQMLREEGADKKELAYFQDRLPIYFSKIKEAFNRLPRWSWTFVGDANFSGVMKSVNSSFLLHRGDELPVAFHDTSLLGNRRSGILITTKRIYQKNAINFDIFELKNGKSISAFLESFESGKKYYIKWCSDSSNLELGLEQLEDAHRVFLFWGNLFRFLQTKTEDILNIPTNDDEIKNFPLKKEKQIVAITRSASQQKLLDTLLKNFFEDYEKQEKIPLENWGAFPDNTKFLACQKYTLLTWGEYAFFTPTAIYYHNKKEGIHRSFNYSDLVGYDVSTNVLNYGISREKINLAGWNAVARNFIKQVTNINNNSADAEGASVLECCFNHCRDFKNNLAYYRTLDIKQAFEQQCAEQHAPEILSENYDNIQIKSIEHGKIILQFCKYFPMVARVHISENDGEDEINEKMQEQERLNDEYQKKIQQAGWTAIELFNIGDEIIKLFQGAIYHLYGVLFDAENISYIEEPDFTFEEPNLIEKIIGGAASVMESIKPYLANTAKRYAEEAKKNGDSEKYEHYMDLHDKYQ